MSHPSLPNYLALIGGSTFGIRDDNLPSSHRLSGPSVLDQAVAAGKSATIFAESMPSNCYRANVGEYAVRHNPWTYFADRTAQRNCSRHDVPLGRFRAGALHRAIAKGTLPTVGLVVPNVCNDAHDCALSTADRWLSKLIDHVRRGPDWRSGRLAIVVTFDENDGSTPNRVLTVVMSHRTQHVVAKQRLSHYSWTRYADQLIGARGLRSARHTRSLKGPFAL